MNTSARSIQRQFLRAACGLVALLLYAPSAWSQTVAQSSTWTPTVVNWICGARNGSNFCTLYAYGEQLSADTTPLTAYGAYRILKGRTAGVGSILAQNFAAMPCERIPPTHLQCIATDEVSLGSEITAVVTAGSTQLNIFSRVPGPLFDWDGDSRITADKEGLMLLRYLLGFNAQGVTSGMRLTNGKSPDETYRSIAAGIDNGWFQFSTNAQPLQATREGEALIRCLNGLRAAPMIAGLSLTDVNAATARCGAITAME